MKKVISEKDGRIINGTVSDDGAFTVKRHSDAGALNISAFIALTPTAVWPDEVSLMMIFGVATLLKLLPLNCTPHPPLK